MNRMLWTLLLVLPLNAAAETKEEVLQAKIRDQAAEWVADLHLEGADIDLDSLASEAVERAARGDSRNVVANWVMQEIRSRALAFASATAVHDYRARYRLPFRVMIPRLCTQGFDGEFEEGATDFIKTHIGRERYAVDFMMPLGTEVLAARAGRIGLVIDGFTSGGMDDEFKERQNTVYVLHPDGTYASYTHLRAGIPVRKGERVRAGQLLGYSGNTGYGSGPHLHFGVYRVQGGRQTSVPFRFGFGPPKGTVLKPGEYYGKAPRANRELRFLLDGEPVDPNVAVQIPKGTSAQLRVELLHGGTRRDVTTSPLLEYATMYPAAMDVDQKGTVYAGPDEGFESQSGDVGLIWVLYLDGRREIGHGRIVFQVVEEPARPRSQQSPEGGA